MATLNTQQKAPLLITDFVGQPVGATGAAIGIEPGGILAWSLGADDKYVLAGEAPGTATVTVIKGGSTGTLVVEVVAAPLTLTLGTPEPK